jgi:hypothetical protein
VFWWTRTQSIRTAAALPFEVALIETSEPRQDGREGDSLASVSPETAAALRAWSGGNPFFLGELLGLIEQGGDAVLTALRRRTLRLPPTLRAAVEGHLRPLGAEARRLLHIAADLGPGFTPGQLARAARVSPEAVTDHLGAALDAHVLEPADVAGRLYRFAHALLRDALRQDLRPASGVAPSGGSRPIPVGERSGNGHAPVERRP